VTYIIVKQDVKFGLTLVRYRYFIEMGFIITNGLSEEMVKSGIIRKVYSGED